MQGDAAESLLLLYITRFPKTRRKAVVRILMFKLPLPEETAVVTAVTETAMAIIATVTVISATVMTSISKILTKDGCTDESTEAD